jgi:hypothetical protein
MKEQSMATPSQDLTKAQRYRLKLIANPQQAECRKCGATYSTADTAGRKWLCRPCLQAYMAASQRNKPAELKAEYSRRYRARQGDAYRQKMASRWRELKAKMSPGELETLRAKDRAKTKRLNAALKDEVFTAYGGWICRCCGETERAFLTIDHLQNNGSKLRKEGVHGHSADFYRWLKKGGFPPDFQVLCMNCNVGKHRNGGVCPHQVRCND